MRCMSLTGTCSNQNFDDDGDVGNDDNSAIAFEGYSATEAGKKLGTTQQGVSWHISKIKKI